MADSAKRKAPAKRGPTKAAALKALGLTQEDLDLLKGLKEGIRQQEEAIQIGAGGRSFSTGHANSTTPEGRYVVNNPTREQQDEMRAAGESVPSRPQPEVPAGAIPQAPKADAYYMRNLRGMELNFRLERQKESNQRRTTLKPRGQRGDLQRLSPDDLNDPALETQVAFGLVEIITEAQAKEIIQKQGINAQQQGNPLLASLRNERGEGYEQNAVRTLSDEEANGYKVADLKTVAEGEYGELEVGRGGIQRERQNPTQTPTGGNPAIVSDGFAQTEPRLGGVDPTAVARDALARSKDLEGPGAGLGHVAVTIEPTRRT